MSEQWIEVVGHPGYKVSDYGNFKTYWKRIRRGVILATESRELKQGKGRGYKVICLYRDGIPMTFSIHRLVMEHFGPPQPPGKPLVLHKDDNRHNNVITNLYWGDHSDNAKDALRNGCRTILRGEDAPGAVLTENDVQTIMNRLEAGERHTHIARDFGVNRECITSISRRKIWRHLSEGRHLKVKETPEERSARLHKAKTYKNNTSGIKGVNFNKDTGKWMARIQVMGKSKYLGLFATLEEAAQAMNEARAKEK